MCEGITASSGEVGALCRVLLAVYRLAEAYQQQHRPRGSVVCLKLSSNVSRFLIVFGSTDKVVLLF